MGLSQKELKRLNDTKRESNKVFNFGESSFKSRGLIEIPVKIEGQKFYLKTEILQGNVPWLIGKKTMSRMGMVIDLKKETV